MARALRSEGCANTQPPKLRPGQLVVLARFQVMPGVRRDLPEQLVRKVEHRPSGQKLHERGIAVPPRQGAPDGANVAGPREPQRDVHRHQRHGGDQDDGDGEEDAQGPDASTALLATCLGIEAGCFDLLALLATPASEQDRAQVAHP